MPSLKKWNVDGKYSFKESFYSYLRSIGKYMDKGLEYDFSLSTYQDYCYYNKSTTAANYSCVVPPDVTMQLLPGGQSGMRAYTCATRKKLVKRGRV